MATFAAKIVAFVKAQQQFEGWYLPKQVVNGVTYPNGSVTYQSNNPAAIKFAAWQTAPIPDGLGCQGRAANSSMGQYPSQQAGLDAGCQFLLTVIQNEMIPFRNQAKLWKLPDAGSLSIAQYFQIYAPSNVDKNHPVNYAAFVAKAVGLPVDTPIKNLLS